MVSPDSYPSMIVLQAEAGFVNKNIILPFGYSCSLFGPLLGQIPMVFDSIVNCNTLHSAENNVER